MDYRVAICDDDAAQSDYIKNLACTWAQQSQVRAMFTLFSSAQALLFDGCEKYDIFLLDIEMPEISGIELAKTIRQRNETAVIIFITGYSDYIAEGYDVSALHYLMKPIDTQKLFAVLDKAVMVLGKRETCLLLEVSGETYRLPLREIRYIEVNGNYATIHAKESLTVKKTLSELEHQLDERFARTGRSFLVNLSCIRRVTRTDVWLADGERVPLSRGAYESINRAIIERL